MTEPIFEVPAGWHPNPDGSPNLRWWDGQQWTEQTAPYTQESSPKGRRRPFAFVAAALVAFVSIGALQAAIGSGLLLDYLIFAALVAAAVWLFRAGLGGKRTT